jgi:hypothetical protein
MLVTLSSLKPFFCNGLKKAWHFSDNGGAEDPGIKKSVLRDQRGGDNPAGVAFLGARVAEPIPTRTRLIDKHEMCACGRHFADTLVMIA